MTFHNVGISAMSACVPHNVVYNRHLDYLIPRDEIEKTIQNIGIEQRRIADVDVTASDLCYKAAVQLLEDNDIDRKSIDVLLFMSQTADYRIPATSSILQNRLGLPKSTACMDVSQGCAGYVYALSAAYAYASLPGINRVLLLDGETFSKVVSRHDKVNWPLYGDAGTATLVEKGDYGDATFILNSDGSGENAVKIHAGMRHPITAQSCESHKREDGNVRNDLQIYMDGMDVFNFALRRVPSGVKQVLEVTGKGIDDVDYLVMHQANRFMTDYFIKKLKFPRERAPYCIGKYGNTSSASVPLTIVSELEGKLSDRHTLVLSGFGAGLSWATALVPFKDCRVSPIQEY